MVRRRCGHTSGPAVHSVGFRSSGRQRRALFLLAPPGRGGCGGDLLAPLFGEGAGLATEVEQQVLFFGVPKTQRVGQGLMGRASGSETFERFLPHTPSSNAFTVARTRMPQFYWQERFGHLQAGRKDWRRNRETVYRHFWGGSRDTWSRSQGTSLSKRNWFAA